MTRRILEAGLRECAFPSRSLEASEKNLQILSQSTTMDLLRISFSLDLVEEGFSMSATTDEWKAELARLPVLQRAELARFLIDSLDQGEDADAEEAWDNELARRAEQIKNGTAKGEPADDVMAELREKHS